MTRAHESIAVHRSGGREPSCSRRTRFSSRRYSIRSSWWRLTQPATVSTRNCRASGITGRYCRTAVSAGRASAIRSPRPLVRILTGLSRPGFDNLIVPVPQVDVAGLGTDRLSDHPFRHGLEVLVQHGLQLEEFRPQRRVDVRLSDPDHHGRATLTPVPIRCDLWVANYQSVPQSIEISSLRRPLGSHSRKVGHRGSPSRATHRIG